VHSVPLSLGIHLVPWTSPPYGHVFPRVSSAIDTKRFSKQEGTRTDKHPCADIKIPDKNVTESPAERQDGTSPFWSAERDVSKGFLFVEADCICCTRRRACICVLCASGQPSEKRAPGVTSLLNGVGAVVQMWRWALTLLWWGGVRMVWMLYRALDRISRRGGSDGIPKSEAAVGQ